MITPSLFLSAPIDPLFQKQGIKKKINVYVYYIILFLICTVFIVFFALFYVFFRFLGQSNVFDPFNFFLILWAFNAFFEYF